MRSLSADQRTCDGSNPTSAEPRMMLSMVSAKLLAGRAWRTKSARAMGMERLRIGLNCPLDDLPQLLRRQHNRIPLHAAGLGRFLHQIGDIGFGHAIRAQRRNLQFAADFRRPTDAI